MTKPLSQESAVAQAMARFTEQQADIPPRLKARAVNAVGPALQARGEWLRLSTRQAIAVAVLVAVKTELEAQTATPDVAGRCPACGGESLFLADGGHVTCRRLDCPDPCAVDDILNQQDGPAEVRELERQLGDPTLTEAEFNRIRERLHHARTAPQEQQ